MSMSFPMSSVRDQASLAPSVRFPLSAAHWTELSGQRDLRPMLSQVLGPPTPKRLLLVTRH